MHLGVQLLKGGKQGEKSQYSRPRFKETPGFSSQKVSLTWVRFLKLGDQNSPYPGAIEALHTPQGDPGWVV